MATPLRESHRSLRPRKKISSIDSERFTVNKCLSRLRKFTYNNPFVALHQFQLSQECILQFARLVSKYIQNIDHTAHHNKSFLGLYTLKFYKLYLNGQQRWWKPQENKPANNAYVHVQSVQYKLLDYNVSQISETYFKTL